MKELLATSDHEKGHSPLLERLLLRVALVEPAELGGSTYSILAPPHASDEGGPQTGAAVALPGSERRPPREGAPAQVERPPDSEP